MKIITTLVATTAICLFVSCDSKSAKTVKTELTDRPNTVEITTRQIQLADGEWTEIVIKQTLSFKRPMIVENISSDLADSMQFGVDRYTDEYDLQNRHVGRTMVYSCKAASTRQGNHAHTG